MSSPKTTPHRKESLPDKPGRYRIDHPDTPMPLDVRAWQMWAVHTSDLDAMGFETREAFFLACLEAAIENLRTENARLREALKNLLETADKCKTMEIGAGGMSIEAQAARSVYLRVPVWPFEDARAALEVKP